MNEIIFTREMSTYNMLFDRIDYKIELENGSTIPICKGEAKKIAFDKLPMKIYGRLFWLKSPKLSIDVDTLEVRLKGDKSKNRFVRIILSLFILTTLMPRMILEESQLTHQLTIIGLFFVFILTIYVFIIKSNNWLIIEKV